MGEEQEAHGEQETPIWDKRNEMAREAALQPFHWNEAREIPAKVHEMNELGEAREAVESTGEAATAAREAAEAQKAVSEANPLLDRMAKMGGIETDPSFSAAEESFFADGEHMSAVTSEASTEAEMAGSMGGRVLGGAMGGLGIVGGGMQIYEGAHEIGEGKTVLGGVDIAAGGAGVIAGGLGLASSIAGGAALGGGLAAASAIAAPIAAVAGLAALGEHTGADLGLFGTATDNEGKTYNRGAFQAAGETAVAIDHSVTDATTGGIDSLFGITDQHSLGGEIASGVGNAVGDMAGLASGVGMEAGALVANVGLGAYGLGKGIDGLAASSGMFGQGDDGKNQSAFGLLDQQAGHLGDATTAGIDSLFGITDKDSLGGEIATGVGDAVHVAGDVAGAGLAAVGEAAGAVVGGVEAAGSWIGDFF